jgi:hypothetical protein
MSLLLVTMVAVGIIGISYRFYAVQQGWPVGRIFADDAAWPAASVILVPIGVGLAWYHDGLISAVATLIMGFFLAFGLTIVTGPVVQIIWVAAMIGSVIAILYAVVRYLIALTPPA